MNFKLAKNRILMLLMAFATALIVQPVSAHFIWVAQCNETGKTKVYFGEGLEADNAMFLHGIAGMKVWQLDQNGKWSTVKFEKKVEDKLGYFECASASPARAIDIDCQYGVFARGASPMMLHYCAKYLNGCPEETKPSGKLKLDVIPIHNSKGCEFKIYFDGKPITDAELTASNLADDSVEFEISAKKNGRYFLDEFADGRWMIRAKKVVEAPGELDGKEYNDKRYYCTLVLDQGKTKSDKSSDNVATSINHHTNIKDLPFGITSFGAAVMNDRIYVYGGHRGDAHNYYSTGQNKRLYEYDLTSDQGWKKIGEGIGLQGLAMVAHNNKLYRLGGFNARNKKGDKSDLHSVKEFAVFDFTSKSWKQLAPMPVARSSFDAVVIGDEIYVVGGWALNGSEKTVWEESAIKINLAADDPQWEKLPQPPFKRRALSVGYQGKKLYIVGGMQDQGGITKKVAVFDLESNTWSEGPELPGSGRMEGFGSSCFNVEGSLIVSTYGGGVFQLSSNGTKWKKIDSVDPGRFFHRLLPLGKKQFALIGGASMEFGKQLDCPVMIVK